MKLFFAITGIIVGSLGSFSVDAKEIIKDNDRGCVGPNGVCEKTPDGNIITGNCECP